MLDSDTNRTLHLAEIHAAQDWLWSALVKAMLVLLAGVAIVTRRVIAVLLLLAASLAVLRLVQGVRSGWLRQFPNQRRTNAALPAGCLASCWSGVRSAGGWPCDARSESETRDAMRGYRATVARRCAYDDMGPYHRGNVPMKC